MKTTEKREARRPSSPNSKGLVDIVRITVPFSGEEGKNLRDRARYETLRWRLEHDGTGRTISAQDIIRRLVKNYFRTEVPVPPDAIGRIAKRRRAES